MTRTLSGASRAWRGIDLASRPTLPAYVQKVVTGCRPVQSVRAVTIRLASVLEDPRTTPATVERLLGANAGLRADVLRIANAAFRDSGTYATDIKRLLPTLGFEELSQAVLTAAAVGGFSRKHPLPDYLWKHGLAMAAVSQEIAMAHSPELAPVAFLNGLLHNIGKFTLLQSFPGRYSQALLRSLQRGDTLTTVEIHWLDTTHAEVGAWVLAGWGFAGTFALPMRLHHCLGVQTRQPVTSEIMALTRTMRLAEDMVDGQLDRERGLRAARMRFDSPARAFFQWTDDDYIDLWNRCHARYERVLSIFE